jgi:hypothetical protein
MTSTSLFRVARTGLLFISLACAPFLAVGEAGAVQLTASWVDNADGTATTRLERRLGSATAFVAMADVPPGSSTYVDSSVNEGTSYCYRALAYNDEGVSPYTDEVCATSGTDGYVLTVNKAGDGTGTVTSAPAGISCGTSCSATYPPGRAVTLNATPASGSIFSGWSGACAGTGACTVAGNAAISVTATFSGASKSVAISKAGDGAGTVISSPTGITCGSTCSSTYSATTTVTLSATAASGSIFTGWSGVCTGTGTCTLNGTGFFPVTATFTMTTATTRSITLGRAGDGAGNVASDPAGINCGLACSATYAAGGVVTLVATPDSGSTFTGWTGGGCAGTGPCTVAGDGPVTVIATFTADSASIVGQRFVDVPPAHPFFAWIEALVPAGLTTGCSTNPPQYCPEAGNTRREMAVFLLRGLHGAGYQPPQATGMFTDVPLTDPLAAWIEQLAREGITGGCSTSPMQYCPDTTVTRAQMAVFLLRAKHGSGYVPPAPIGAMFLDVPGAHPFARWIEQLAREGVTGGCSSSPAQYCPDAPVTRGQMAVFLVRTFDLPR